MILPVRSEIARSMIRATAMMDAARRNQIGQPAAWSIANNAFPCSFFGSGAADCKQNALPEQVNAGQQRRSSRRPLSSGCSAFGDIHKKLWTSLWIVYE